MRLHELLSLFDDALDWQVDDPFLDEHPSAVASEDPWPPMRAAA